jgi:tyrosyl-tRNA synthetase
MGGADQWGNICAGIDLTRRLEGAQLYGITFPLLTTRTGAKMGKTASGAVWLAPERTSPYDFYQYWINVDDEDVERFLALFTLLPMKEVRELGKRKGEDLREAKRRLAFEATAITHSEEEAEKARDAAEFLFGRKNGGLEAMPTTDIEPERLEKGIPAWQLFHEVGLCKSRADARRLIQQGGAYVNEKRLETFDQKIGAPLLDGGDLLLRAGKKRFHRIQIKGS